MPPVTKARLTWTALWFFCIAAGFLLLAIRSYVLGGRFSLTLLRLVIAAGFAILGYYQMRSPAGR